jgi:hypothetical protein
MLKDMLFPSNYFCVEDFDCNYYLLETVGEERRG